MKLRWSEDAWDDYLYWQRSDPDLLRRINALLQDIRRSLFKGIGKPEPLRGDLAGWWSRRIRGDHRIVYRAIGSGEEQRVEIIACVTTIQLAVSEPSRPEVVDAEGIGLDEVAAPFDGLAHQSR